MFPEIEMYSPYSFGYMFIYMVGVADTGSTPTPASQPDSVQFMLIYHKKASLSESVKAIYPSVRLISLNSGLFTRSSS